MIINHLIKVNHTINLINTNNMISIINAVTINHTVNTNNVIYVHDIDKVIYILNILTSGAGAAAGPRRHAAHGRGAGGGMLCMVLFTTLYCIFDYIL